MQATGDNKQTVVVGLGATGLACVRFLRNKGRRVAVTDSRPRPPGMDEARVLDPDMPMALGGFDSTLLHGADEIVLSPGVPPDAPELREARSAGIPVFGEIELFARHCNGPVVGITGSNGKSTVTTLLGRMASAAGRDVAVGGNLGTPALNLLREPAPDAYVLELSSFQLETTRSLRTVAAVVLNISADHMDRHASVEQYAAIKSRVYDGHGLMVLNADDPRVMEMARPGRQQVLFSRGEPTGPADYGLRTHAGETWLVRGDTRLVAASRLRLRGAHNLVNALAALALADALQLPRSESIAALEAFTGLPHRTEWVATVGGVDWYNDSKATNVGASAAAIQGMPGPLVLILGGDGKGADFTPLRDVMDDSIRAVVLIGRDGPLVEAALRGAVTMVTATDMDDAVVRAAALAQPGDSVLLSPACASFDMFSNYEERGRMFATAVGGLAS